MLTNPEELPFPESDPFDYGDRTVLQLRAQPFVVEDAYGTVLTMPIDTTTRVPVPEEEVFVDEDPMVRMERKLDAALRQIAALQQRLESLDVTLMRALTR
ncbi:MAG: hypothetical protein ACLGH0_06050 [Thermoanaerobaculia bacterium]